MSGGSTPIDGAAVRRCRARRRSGSTRPCRWPRGSTPPRGPRAIDGRRGFDLDTPLQPLRGSAAAWRRSRRRSSIASSCIWSRTVGVAAYVRAISAWPAGSRRCRSARRCNAATGAVHLAARRRLRRHLRPGVRALVGRARRGAAGRAHRPEPEGQQPRRAAGRDRHPAPRADVAQPFVVAGWAADLDSTAIDAGCRHRCTCGRIRCERRPSRSSSAPRRTAARGPTSRRSSASGSAAAATG